MQPNWYHEDCFFAKQRPTTHTDIGNFNKLKMPDQKKLKAKIGECILFNFLPLQHNKKLKVNP